MLRTASQILDAREVDIWVMDPRVEYVDEIEPLTDTQLERVRGVSGVEWAVPFYKGLTVAHASDGLLQQVILLGVDDAKVPPPSNFFDFSFVKEASAKLKAEGWEP